MGRWLLWAITTNLNVNNVLVKLSLFESICNIIYVQMIQNMIENTLLNLTEMPNELCAGNLFIYLFIYFALLFFSRQDYAINSEF